MQVLFFIFSKNTESGCGESRIRFHQAAYLPYLCRREAHHQVSGQRDAAADQA